MIQMNLPNRKRFTDLENKHDCQGEWTLRKFRMVMYTTLYLTWITSKDLL